MKNSYETSRLNLREFQKSDATEVQRIAGKFEIANTTLNVPHPYEDGMAESWIERQQAERILGNLFTFAVVLKSENRLVGATSIIPAKNHGRAELAYWVDVDYWNRGIGTEAAAHLVDQAFLDLDLQKVWGAHFTENPASGRIMEKLGMKPEGLLRKHYLRLGRYRDTAYFGILRSEWEMIRNERAT